MLVHQALTALKTSDYLLDFDLALSSQLSAKSLSCVLLRESHQ